MWISSDRLLSWSWFYPPQYSRSHTRTHRDRLFQQLRFPIAFNSHLPNDSVHVAMIITMPNAWISLNRHSLSCIDHVSIILSIFPDSRASLALFSPKFILNTFILRVIIVRAKHWFLYFFNIWIWLYRTCYYVCVFVVVSPAQNVYCLSREWNSLRKGDCPTWLVLSSPQLDVLFGFHHGCHHLSDLIWFACALGMSPLDVLSAAKSHLRQPLSSPFTGRLFSVPCADIQQCHTCTLCLSISSLTVLVP